MTNQFTYPILNTNLVFTPCPTAPHTTLNQLTFVTSVKGSIFISVGLWERWFKGLSLLQKSVFIFFIIFTFCHIKKNKCSQKVFVKVFKPVLSIISRVCRTMCNIWCFTQNCTTETSALGSGPMRVGAQTESTWSYENPFFIQLPFLPTYTSIFS